MDVESGPLRLGHVAFGEVIKQVSLVFVPGAAPGDYVVVHAGTAIEVIDEDKARRSLETLRLMEEP
jgi:hydrogenase expression/formation protein HypC